ncbi:MAG TPA: hypothetical protein VEX86_13515, partial [Longimicrobium sp.]|nr:hypothetical protein [Longimicrobium sp.]
MRIGAMLVICCAALAGCRASQPAARAASEQDAFWASLQRLCGQAFAGSLVQGSAADTSFAGKPLVMHVRRCSPA